MALTRLNRGSNRRGGSILVLALVMLGVMLTISAFVISIAQLQLVRSELRLGVDAAARSGMTDLVETQSVEHATQTVIDVAKAHTAAGAPLQVDSRDVVFGNSTADRSGRYQFRPSVRPLNSVRIEANGVTRFFLGNLLGMKTGGASQSAIATRVTHDICVVVDRSGSMAWDMGGDEFTYPDPVSLDAVENYFRPPHPSESRWAALRNAMAVFVDTLKNRELDTHVALTSYSSDVTFRVLYSTSGSVDQSEYDDVDFVLRTFGDDRFVEFHVEAATLDQALTEDIDKIQTGIARIALNPLIGDTNIEAGLQEGIAALADARVTSLRSIILLSDGLNTEGRPLAVCQRAANHGVTIHTISFSDGADRQLMEELASIGRGEAFHALTADELAEAFEAIAESLPALLTDLPETNKLGEKIE